MNERGKRKQQDSPVLTIKAIMGIIRPFRKISDCLFCIKPILFSYLMINAAVRKQLLIVSTSISIFFLTACSASKHSSRSSEDLPTTSLQKKYAELLEVPAGKITNKNLYTFIDKWLNTKYRYGAQQNTGIDCSGFTQLLYDAVYKKKISRSSLQQYNDSKHIGSRRNLEEGDLVFFTTVSGKKISHVGVYLQNDRFVNATNKGVIISDMNLKYWSDRFVAGGKP